MGHYASGFGMAWPPFRSYPNDCDANIVFISCILIPFLKAMVQIPFYVFTMRCALLDGLKGGLLLVALL